MKIKISKHAMKRIAERGITEEGVLAILSEEPAVLVDSDKDPDASIVYGTYAGKVWAVVYNSNTGTVITVRRARKGEAEFYAQEKGN